MTRRLHFPGSVLYGGNSRLEAVLKSIKGWPALFKRGQISADGYYILLEIVKGIFKLRRKFRLAHPAAGLFQFLLQSQNLLVQNRVFFSEPEKTFRHLLKKGVNLRRVKTAEFNPELFVNDVLWRDLHFLLFHKLILLQQPFV